VETSFLGTLIRQLPMYGQEKIKYTLGTELFIVAKIAIKITSHDPETTHGELTHTLVLLEER
jgi:hypothetical protein